MDPVADMTQVPFDLILNISPRRRPKGEVYYPLLRKARTLYEVCLQSIVNNSIFWIQDGYEKTGLKRNKLNTLPPRIQQDILDTYERIRGQFAFKHKESWLTPQREWRLFVTSKIQKVTISESTEKPSLEHIAVTCKNLKVLEVKAIKEIYSCLKILTPCLGTITEMHFEPVVHVNSSAMKHIKTHCIKLRILDMKSCFVSDKAICQMKHMPSLMELYLQDTEVSPIGLSHVLKYNPQLITLRHSDVGHALYKLHYSKPKKICVETSLSSSSTFYYRLSEIEVELPTKDPESLLAVMVAACPKLEKVKLEFDCRSSPFSLVPLVKLECLGELIVQCVLDSNEATTVLNGTHHPPSPETETETSTEPVTLFEGSILPILQAHGKSLKTLLLEGVHGVDMMILESHCPQLACLGLYYNYYSRQSFFVPDDITGTKPFPYLRKLLFGSNSDHDVFPASYLLWLLSNKELEELSLSTSPLFTDDLFSTVFTNSGYFPNLRHLELEYCNASPEVISEFLHSCGQKSLRDVTISGPFVHEQASSALCYVLCNGLDIQIHAHSYTFLKMKKRLVRYRQELCFASSRRVMAILQEKKTRGHHMRLADFYPH